MKVNKRKAGKAGAVGSQAENVKKNTRKGEADGNE